MNHYETIRKAWAGDTAYRTPMSDKARRKDLDKFRGCLIGGAAGDALGYAVEFMSESRLFSEFGRTGITEYALSNGVAQISDDTQMTLFTANGLLFATTRGAMRGIMGSYPSYIAEAYQEWYKTQVGSYPARGSLQCSWLLNVPELYAARAPGNTCMSEIRAGCTGTIERPVNNSKGCGGVMRAAPIGLYFGAKNRAPLAIDLMGADVAALTHGHEMGYIPAAMLVHIISLLSHSNEITLKEAVLDGITAVERIFSQAEHLSEFVRLMERAVELSEKDADDLASIHQLGQGWTGDQALAIAVYCALKYADDFDKAILAAVNHGGDSDSTGAITGNILGAHLGLSGIPQKYTDKLELVDVITELADDLFHDCQINEYSAIESEADKAWFRKYVEVTYPSRSL